MSEASFIASTKEVAEPIAFKRLCLEVAMEWSQEEQSVMDEAFSSYAFPWFCGWANSCEISNSRDDVTL